MASSFFRLRTAVLKPTSAQAQPSAAEESDSWGARLAVRACTGGAYRLAMPLHLYSLSLPEGSSTHCHFYMQTARYVMLTNSVENRVNLKAAKTRFGTRYQSKIDDRPVFTHAHTKAFILPSQRCNDSRPLQYSVG